MASAATWRMKTLLFVFFLYGVRGANDQKSGSPPRAKEVRPKDLVVVVLSQPQRYHANRAQLFKQHFEQQVTKFPETDRTDLILTHERWPEINGAWTVFPLIAHLVTLYGDKRWVILCNEETRIDLQQLYILLPQYDETEEPFLGRALRDQQSTIIHHFAFFEDPSVFAYPDFAAGVAVALPLLKSVAEKLAQGVNQKIQFSIDPQHEFAKYILDNLGERLTPVCEFCGTTTNKSENCQCATWQPISFPTDCGPPVEKGNLFVAVKTCSKFHKDRVPVVQETWGQETELIEYYSEVEDSSIPTVDLGVPNTESGHCGKTSAVLRHVANSKQLGPAGWLLIADDDTIINLELLRRLLSCYESDEPVFIGERYGFAVASGYGYNYITGGGGMVFNKAAVDLLAKEFSCPSNESPDDMLLGMFFNSRGIPQTHSRYFHQARPEDYSEDLLKTQVPVSFHKHWNSNPYKVYERLKAAKLPQPSLSVHEEL